jgi:glycosyltransferase involved in cell wall biosynthesis
LNILLVADVSIASVIGGAERVLYEESTRLVKKGHAVHVLTRRLPHHTSDAENIDGVEEHRYRYQEKPFPLFLKSILSDCRQTFSSLQENSPFHIINFHQPFSAAGIISSRASHTVPRLYTCHSLSFEEYISRSFSPRNPKDSLLHWVQVRVRRSAEQTLLRKSDRVVVLSDYTRRKLERVYGLQSANIRVIPGGVDLERFKPSTEEVRIRDLLGLPEGRFILFTVRNLVPRMGLENLISAFKIILNEHNNLCLVIGGEGPLGTALKDQAKGSEIADFIHFVGYIPEEDLPSYYQMADLFILPSTELEGFGLVTVEALASGLPVLGTPVGGTKEILTKIGPELLFDDSTPESMATGILKALNGWGKNPSAYKDISKTCRQIAEEHYSWENHVTQLEDLFYELRDL